jgi:positive regulator of sigma E activity
MKPHVNRYPGTVVAVQDNRCKIALAEPAGCGACHRGLCRDAGRLVEVSVKRNLPAAGQKVWVEVSDRSAWVAIILFYGIPSALMIGALVALLAAKAPEGVAGVAALLAPAPYYLGLIRTRKYWNHRISLTLQGHE